MNSTALFLISLGIPLIPFLGTEGLTHESKESKEQLEEIKNLESEIFSWQTGEIVIKKDEVLSRKTFRFKSQLQLNKTIREFLQESNAYTFTKMKPKEEQITKVLLLRKDQVKEIKDKIYKKGKLEIQILSDRNYLLGEDYVYGYIEVIPK